MPRLVTCCYCGARATLAADRSGMLACEACGAPIQQVDSAAQAPRPATVPEPAAAAVVAAAERPAPKQAEKPEKKPKKRKKRKGLFSRALEEVWDKVEDIFD